MTTRLVAAEVIGICNLLPLERCWTRRGAIREAVPDLPKHQRVLRREEINSPNPKTVHTPFIAEPWPFQVPTIPYLIGQKPLSTACAPRRKGPTGSKVLPISAAVTMPTVPACSVQPMQCILEDITTHWDPQSSDALGKQIITREIGVSDKTRQTLDGILTTRSISDEIKS
jgi:hypothetical protein